MKPFLWWDWDWTVGLCLPVIATSEAARDLPAGIRLCMLHKTVPEQLQPPTDKDAASHKKAPKLPRAIVHKYR